MKLKALLFAAVAAVFSFASCDELGDLTGQGGLSGGLPSIEFVDFDEDVITFDADGGERSITLKANRKWTVEEDASWIEVAPKEGPASEEGSKITIKVVKNELDEDDPTAGFDREADVKFTVGAKSLYLTVKQNGPQGSTEALVVYYNNFDKEKAEKGDKWATYLDSFEGWKNATGTGAESATYGFTGITARTNSGNGSAGKYSIYEGSGMNYLWMGSGKPYFTVKDIALPAGKVNYTISFGTERYEYSETGEIDNTFNWEEFKAYASIDGTKWSVLACEFAAGNLPNGQWDLASATIKVPEGTEKLSLYFISTVGSAYAIDDLKVEESLFEGKAVDFESGIVIDPAQGEAGDESDATAIYSNNYDKQEATKTFGSGSSYPYLDQFDGWMNHAGTGSADVTYSYKGMSARANSYSNASYSDYAGSGLNNLFFGKEAYFSTNNIALNGATNLTLTFGTEKYSQDGDSVFKNSEYHIYLSNDGKKWVELTDYTFAGGTTAGRWNVATANFSVPSGTERLSICMQVDVASVYRLDDFKLAASQTAGTAVDFSNAVEKDFGAGSDNQGGSESDSAAIYSNNYDKAAASEGDKGWPYLDQTDVWKNAAGTGSANVTYASSGVSVRNNSNSDGKYSDYGGSGLNNIFFGKTPYFATNNIALNGETNLTLTFGTEKYSQTNGSVFTNSEYHIWLSADGGSKWVEFTDYTFAGGTTSGRWNVATANFTVPAGTETLSICMQVDVASSYRLDDMKLVASQTAGTAVDFTNAVEKDFSADSGSTPVTPPTGDGSVSTIAQVLALGANATVASGTTIEGVVISNMALNNLTSKKGLYIQDETAGLQFYLAANHEFAFGDKVKVDLGGATIGAYNGAVQISGLALDKITKISSGNAVTPKKVSVADFLANKYEGQYIEIEGVQVVDADLSKTFVMGGAHTSINVETADGKTFVIFSSKYASYGADTVPQGSGSIKGISSISKGAMQLIFAQASDFAGLTGTRFDGESGGETPTPPADGDEGGEVTPPSGEVTGTVLTISKETINNPSWTTNGYGSQKTNDLSTYLNWTVNGASFIGCKMCIPPTTNAFADVAIQCQGNASDAAKIFRLGNTTSLGKIRKITVVSYNEKYTPNFNLALGTAQVVGTDVPSSMIAASTMTTTQDGTKYTTVYEPTSDVGFFALYKNTTGAFYLSEVTVEYELSK